MITRRHLNGIWRLTRFEEFVSFVIITTLFGAAAGGGSIGWSLLGVLVANWLAVGFAFMINDVEDAADDALTLTKARRNPISAGKLSPRAGRSLSCLAAILAALIYASLGLGPFVTGLACLIIAYLYSWRPIRLKSIPIVDLVAHAAMLAGLQFLAADLTFGGYPNWQWVFPLILVLAISLYGELYNELRDFDGDCQAGVTHTASLIGPKVTHLLMMAWLAVGLFSAIITFFVVRLVPVWVLLLAVGLGSLLSWQRLSRKELRQAKITRMMASKRRLRLNSTAFIRLHLSFQKPLEIGTAVALLAWFASQSLHWL
jgi:4-hydroxybenzoate polyprenyltransferase